MCISDMHHCGYCSEQLATWMHRSAFVVHIQLVFFAVNSVGTTAFAAVV